MTKHLQISNEDAKKILYSWEQEYAADQGGLLLTMGAMMVKKWDAPLSYWGIELFLNAMDCIERGLCIMRNGHDDFYWRGGRSDGELGSHPPAERRKDFVEVINDISKTLKIKWIKVLKSFIGEPLENDNQL